MAAKSTAAACPAADMVTVRIPVDPTNRKDTTVVVGLNGRMYKIRRGVSVEVPRGVAEILENSEKQAEAALEYIEKTANKEAEKE